MRRLLVAITLALALVACGAAQTVERPACSDRALLEIESRYVAEIMIACDGQRFETCPARPAIDARFDALREEWVQCK